MKSMPHGRLRTFFKFAALSALLSPFLAAAWPAAGVAQEAQPEKKKEEVFFKADSSYINDQTGARSLLGNAEVRFREAVVSADQIVLDEKRKFLTALGQVSIDDREMVNACPLKEDGSEIEGCDNKVYGEHLYFDYENEYFEILEARGTTAIMPEEDNPQNTATPPPSNPSPNPDFTNTDFPQNTQNNAPPQSRSSRGKAKEPKILFYKGKIAKGTRRKITLFNGAFTTCEEWCRQEYHVTGKKITIYPNIKIIVRKAVFFIEGQRAMYLPVYMVSLKDRDEDSLPKYGYDDIRGFWFEEKQTFLIREEYKSKAILNYYQKLYTEFGVEHFSNYGRFGMPPKTPNLDAGTGYFEIRRQQNRKNTGGNVNTNLKWRQTFYFNQTENLAVNYAKQDTFNQINRDRQISTLQWGFAYSRDVYSEPEGKRREKRSGMKIAHSQNDRQKPTANKSANTNLAYDYIFKRDLTANMSWAETDTMTDENIPSNREGNLTVTPKWSPKLANVTAKFTRRYDLDGDSYPTDDNSPIETDRPEVTIAPSALILNAFNPLEDYIKLGSLKFVYGNYQKGSDISGRLRKSQYETNWNLKTLNLTGKMSLSTSYTYTQNLYQTGDKQYKTNLNTTLNHNIRKRNQNSITLSTRFTASHDNGGIPKRNEKPNFQSRDGSGGERGALSTNLSMNKKRTRFTASFGKNYTPNSKEKNKYMPLNLQYTRDVSQWSNLNLSTAFDFEEDKWSEFKPAMNLYRRNVTTNLSARYSLDQKHFEEFKVVNGFSRKNGWDIKVESLYQKRGNEPFIRQILATKTNCCTMIQMSWLTKRKEFVISYNILAFPGEKIGLTSGDEGLKFNQSVFETDKIQGGGENVE